MKKLKLNLQNIEGAAVLTRQQLKMVMGGMEEGSGDLDDGEKSVCLGCSNDSECRQVGKGTCNYCETHKKNCCSGWHTH